VNIASLIPFALLAPLLFGNRAWLSPGYQNMRIAPTTTTRRGAATRTARRALSGRPGVSWRSSGGRLPKGVLGVGCNRRPIFGLAWFVLCRFVSWFPCGLCQVGRSAGRLWLRSFELNPWFWGHTIWN